MYVFLSNFITRVALCNHYLGMLHKTEPKSPFFRNIFVTAARVSWTNSYILLYRIVRDNSSNVEERALGGECYKNLHFYFFPSFIKVLGAQHTKLCKTQDTESCGLVGPRKSPMATTTAAAAGGRTQKPTRASGQVLRKQVPAHPTHTASC